MGQYYDTNQLLGYIDKYAPMYGVDPGTAKRVFKSEGGNGDIWQSTITQGNMLKENGREASYGPFQFYKGGMGADFQRDTGLDFRNPQNLEQMTQYAMKHAGQNGWGAWYGAKKAGIGNREGIGGNPVGTPTAIAGGVPAGSSPTPMQTAMAAAVDNKGAVAPEMAGGTAQSLQGQGLIGLLSSGAPVNKANIGAALGGQQGIGSAVQGGLGFLAQLAGGGGGGGGQLPPPPVIEDNSRPDMSLLAMMSPKRKRMMQSGNFG